jgi:hypothetical protein
MSPQKSRPRSKSLAPETPRVSIRVKKNRKAELADESPPSERKRASEAPTQPPPPLSSGPAPKAPLLSGPVPKRRAATPAARPRKSDKYAAAVDEVTADLTKDPRRDR